jgi:undecaprenyl-diphosphatase
MTIQSLDTQLLLLINHGTENTLFDILMPALSYQGYLLVLPFLFYMFVRGRTQVNSEGKGYLNAALWTIVISCCAVYLAEWAEDVLKIAVARERPCRAIEGIRLITACPKSFSMPSGHAISSFAFAIPLFYLTREYIAGAWRSYPLVLALLIAFSRMYLGVHYPTDVLAGALLGTLIGLVLSILYQLMATKEFVKWEKR